MNFVIGDIGNTKTKICLAEDKNFKIKKLIYFDSKKIHSSKFLKKTLRKIVLSLVCQEVALHQH